MKNSYQDSFVPHFILHTRKVHLKPLVSMFLSVCVPSPLQNLRCSCHRTVRPQAAGEGAVVAKRVRRVPRVMRSLHLRLQADIQHLRGSAGPPTLRPAQGRSCRVEKGSCTYNMSTRHWNFVFVFLGSEIHILSDFCSGFEGLKNNYLTR